MTARLGTTLSTLLARFRRPRLVLPLDVSGDLMQEYDKRIAELLADEREHSLGLGPADGETCYALSDVVAGWACTLKEGHRSGHVWATGGGK